MNVVAVHYVFGRNCQSGVFAIRVSKDSPMENDICQNLGSSLL